jgi:hypothetical protein
MIPFHFPVKNAGVNIMRKIILALAMVLVIVFTAGCNATSPSVSLPPATSSAPTPTHSTAPTTTVKPQPPAVVSGLIYNRDADTTFTVDTAPAALALSGAAVTIGSDNIVTDASGNYNFANVTPGFHAVTVVKDGYIPTTVSWNFVSGQSYTFNIGLYKAPAAITPRPGFINGIITWDAGGWLIDYYYTRGLFPPTYSAAKQQAGGNLVTVSDPVFVREVDTGHVVMSNVSASGSYWRMMNETEYTALVNDAHSKGLKFMLWLGVMEEGKLPYNDIVYTGGPRADSFWDSWFSEYQKYTLQYAAMAQKLGMDYINLGHDMGYANGQSHFSGGAADSLARWQKLVAAIRAVYSGRVTYFGGTSAVDNYYEDNDYPPGFVDLFDAVGINVQSVNAAFNPTLAELKASVTSLLDRYTDWNVPVFIMVRTPSVDGGTGMETYIEPLLAVNHEADKHGMNLFQQADVYEAFYEVVNSRPAGPGQVMGVFPWGYNYLDDYLNVPGKYDGQMAMDKSANVRGKPAEAVLKFWDFNK